MYPSSDQNAPNFDDMSDDAAATEFENAFGNLVSQTTGTPEDVAQTVEELLETLTSCVTKVATLDDMVAYVLDSAAGGQVIHYAASNFLAHLAEKFTSEVQGQTLSRVLIRKLREVAEKCIASLDQLASGNADPSSVVETRNLAVFFADLSPKLMVLGSFKAAVPAVIFSVFELLDKLVAKTNTVPKAEFLENCFCAVQMLKLTGPTIDELIRGDTTISQKLPGIVPKLYQTIRNILIDHNDLTPRIRAGIIKVLEFRASRWGEVPSPDQPMEPAVAGLDEVDPVWYGPDNMRLSKEETDFLNGAAAEVGPESDEEDVDEGEPYVVHGHATGNECEEAAQEVHVDENLAPIWRYEAVPDAAMEEFRRRLKPDYKPDGAGDRVRHN